jgi:putative ABC transport system permease protein
VGGAPYRVIGLLQQQGRTLGQSRDNLVILPIDTFRRAFGSRDSLDLLVQARGGVEGVDVAADEVRAVLRALRHTDFRADDPFGLVTAESLQDLWRQISAGAFLLTILIASVSLGVGGIVIMNIMLVAVAERTREIGIRKALGARRRDIMRQFLVESASLSVLGASLGIAFGIGLAEIVSAVSPVPARVALWSIPLAVTVGAGVGIVAGIYPASRAARLDPIAALRQE